MHLRLKKEKNNRDRKSILRLPPNRPGGKDSIWCVLTAAVIANTSALLARVDSLKTAANTTVKAQTIPRRTDMFWTKYKVMIELMGATEASTVPKNSTTNMTWLSE